MIATILASTVQMTTSSVVPPPIDTSPLVVVRKSQQRKRVSFFPQVYTRYTLHRTDYTAAEKEQTWMTMNELRSLKKSCIKLALELSNKNNNKNNNNINNNSSSISMNQDKSDEKSCFRGLEGRTREGMRKRKRIKNAARDAVLSEQSLQRRWSSDSMIDEVLLADAYYEWTECSQVEAYMVGLRDQADALNVWSSPPPQKLQEDNDSVCYMNESHDDNETGNGNTNITTVTTITNSDNDFRHKSMIFASLASSRSKRSIQSLSRLTSSRRILTDAYFQAV